MPPALAPYLDIFLDSAKWFLIVLAIFVPLGQLFPSKPNQPAFRKELAIDSVYWFCAPFLYSPFFRYFVQLYSSFYSLNYLYGWGTGHVATLPLLVQALLILLIGDFFQYWLHRFFHRDPLWKYHAIHHSPTEIDWHTSSRFHPINIILYSTSINALLPFLGFSREAFEILIPFNTLYSPLVHANVPWTYGPFRYILASPVFHRWHHTHLNEGGNKNFAPTFSFLDVIFGTFYMPKDRQPELFGIEGNPVPESVIGQLSYPFRQKS